MKKKTNETYSFGERRFFWRVFNPLLSFLGALPWENHHRAEEVLCGNAIHQLQSTPFILEECEVFGA